MTPVISLTRRSLATCSVIVVMAAFFLVLWEFPMAKPGSVTLLSAEFLREYGYSQGSYDQRSAHLSAVFAVAVLSAVGFIAANFRLVRGSGRAGPTVNLWVCLVATLALYAVYRALVPGRFNTVALILAAAFFLFVILAPRVKQHSVEVFVLLLIGGYAAVLIVPGFTAWPIPLLQGDPNSLAQVELHLNSLTQPGVNIAAGQNFFDQIPFSYGFLMPSILSVIDRRFGPTDVGDQIRFVQVCQVLFSVLAIAGYLCCRPRSYLGALAAILLAGPYWASAGIGEWHPNQTGFRSLTLPLSMLALVFAGRQRPQNAAWELGAVGGLSLLINFETTVAVGVGYLVYMGLRMRQQLMVPVLRMAAAGFSVIVAYFVIYRLALGRLPFSSHLLSNFTPLSELTSGEIGLRLFTAGVWKENYYVVAFAFVMFIHAIYVVIDAFIRLGSGPLPHRPAFRAAAAVILIIWFAYYFNLPNWWQIWTYYCLYGYLLIDLFEPRLFALGRWTQRPLRELIWRPMRSQVSRIVPMIMLAFMIPFTNYDLLQYTRGFLYPPWFRTDHDAGVVSGILVPRPMADELREKVEKLEKVYRASGGRTIYLTFDVSFVPMMSRIFMPVPERNLWGYIPGGPDFDRTIDAIAAKRPEAILIDAPVGPLAVPGARKDFQDHVRRSLSRSYHLSETEAGWQIWRPGPGSGS